MQAAIETCRPTLRRPSAQRARARSENATGPTVQVVPAGTQLFSPGEARKLFRVESGALCHSMLWPDGRNEVIEFAFPGDVVGLGHLDRHVSVTSALVDTVVSVVDEGEFFRELRADDVLELRFGAASEREFDYLRERARQAPVRKPESRVASYLLAVVAMNAREGSAVNFVPDESSNEAIAAMLQLDRDAMAGALLQLQRQRLIAPEDGGLRIVDVCALERFADAA